MTGILWVFVCQQMCSIYTGKKEQIIFCYEKPYNKIIGFHFTWQVSKSPGKQINLMCFKFGPADLRSKSMTAWYIISATWSLGYPSCPVPMAGNTRVVYDESLAASKHFLINSVRTYWKFRLINNIFFIVSIIFKLFWLKTVNRILTKSK